MTRVPRPAVSDGPYESREQVRDLPSVRGVYDSFRASPGAGRMAPRNAAMLEAACAAAGVELGAYDRRALKWMASWEPEVCAVIAGLISRAASGQVEGPSQSAVQPGVQPPASP